MTRRMRQTRGDPDMHTALGVSAERQEIAGSPPHPSLKRKRKRYPRLVGGRGATVCEGGDVEHLTESIRVPMSAVVVAEHQAKPETFADDFDCRLEAELVAEAERLMQKGDG